MLKPNSAASRRQPENVADERKLAMFNARSTKIAMHKDLNAIVDKLNSLINIAENGHLKQMESIATTISNIRTGIEQIYDKQTYNYLIDPNLKI